MKPTLRILALAPLLAVGAACGPVPLKSVRVTGEMGASLATHAKAAGAATVHCTLLPQETRAVVLEALQGALADAGPPVEAIEDPEDVCSVFAGLAPTAGAGLSALALYGAALARLGGGQEPALYDSTRAILAGGQSLGVFALRKSTESVIAGLVQGIANLVTDEYRRNSAAKVIKKVEPQVKKLTEGLSVYLGSELAMLQNVRDDVYVKARTQAPVGSDAILPMPARAELAERATLYALLERLDALTAEITAAKLAVEAFGAAHTRLEKDAQHLESKDRALYEDIMCRTTEIYGAFAEGQRPPGCKSGGGTASDG